MQDKIRKYIEERKMIVKGDKLIVGVSGGADSICLLSLLDSWKQEMDFDITAVHVHHGLREGSADRDEQYVRELCVELDISLLVYHRNVKEESEKRRCSIEEAGREVRHEIFREVKETYQGAKIVLAHHKNDNAETLLMNLARGTGIRGLKGISPVNGDIVRPLLCVERLEIEAYLKEQKIAYQIDETNSSNVYLRNRIRNDVIPYMQKNVNAKTVEHMSRTSEQLQQIQEYLQQEVQVYFDKSVCREGSSFVIKEIAFRQVPKVLRAFVIQHTLEQASGKRKDISQVHIQAIESLFDSQVGRRIDLPYAIQAVRCYTGVRLEKKIKNTQKKYKYNLFDVPEMKIGNKLISHRVFSNIGDNVGETKDMQLDSDMAEKRYTKQFDYDIIKGNVMARTRESGDYIIIDEQGHKQKIKDYFINQKVPSEKRDTILLIAEGKHVLWVDGYRSSFAYRVSAHTKKILEIEIREDMEDADER